MDNNSIGTIIKNARKAKGYSRWSLSYLCGVSRQQIGNIETGKSKPRASTLKLICNTLDIDFNDFLTKSGYIDEEAKNSLATTIKNVRMSKGYSQHDLSDLCGISQREISYIEIGKSRPRIELLEKICAVLSLDFEEVSKLS